MSYYMNPFEDEFRGNWVLGDRQHSITFVVPGNKIPRDYMISIAEPYDLSSLNTLTINFAKDKGSFKAYHAISINIAGSTPSATTANEVVTTLNANSSFSSYFVASVTVETNYGVAPAGTSNKVLIKPILPKDSLKCYITPISADRILKFNLKAGIGELPTYFSRHTISNLNNYTDCTGSLYLLDPSGNSYHAALIDAAGFNSGTVKDDYLLLKGRSGIFLFQKNTVDGSNRITQTIEYPAGAQAGDLAKKIKYTYSSSNTSPSQVTQEPYTLTGSDIVTP